MVLKLVAIGLLLVAVLALPSIYELAYVGFSANPIGFVFAIIFLFVAALFASMIAFGISDSITNRNRS